MKQLLKDFLYDIERSLGKMQVSKMSLKDRVEYEKAKEKLDAAKKLVSYAEVKTVNQ